MVPGSCVRGVPRAFWLLVAVAAGAVARPAGEQGQRRIQAGELAEFSLEELMNIEVRSAGRKQQKLSHTAAAVYVVTQEDIHRSGATSVPEALRMVPGLHVAQIDSTKWAISARGSNARFANKMLVLVDGRSVYTGLWSGTYWDQHDLLLEDIERIEVIRGPGATMWGANAVNGVINIITKSAKDSQGWLATATGGNLDRGTAVRYGGKFGDKVHYRAYSKMFDRGHSLMPDGRPAGDRWRATRGGGRMDWQVSAKDSLSIHGDIYEGNSRQEPAFAVLLGGPSVDGPERVYSSGGYAQLRWDRKFSERSETALQIYFTDEERGESAAIGKFDTIDFDIQHRFALAARHDLMWGGGYRRTMDRIRGLGPSGAEAVRFRPDSRDQNLVSVFLQDDFSLVEDRLVLTAGSKLQRNDYTGLEIQPNARLLWTPDARQGLWGAMSRAVRTPSRLERDVQVDFPIVGAPSGVIGRLLGQPGFEAETVFVYEAGYRRQIGSRVAADLAVFHSRYDRLQDTATGLPFLEMTPQPRLVVPMRYVNSRKATAWGVEIATSWSLRKTWKVNANYSWLDWRYSRKAESQPSAGPSRGPDPAHQAQLRSSLELTPKLSLDTSLYVFSALRDFQIPGHARLDARLGWRVSPVAELSLNVNNLLDGTHLEFPAEAFLPTQALRRSVFVNLAWRF